MMGFTLSKLNLLILVTVLFSIISFFLFALTGIVVGNLAQLMVRDYSESVSGLVGGSDDKLCHTITVAIPRSEEHTSELQSH